jgi:hypothetical protein
MGNINELAAILGVDPSTLSDPTKLRAAKAFVQGVSKEDREAARREKEANLTDARAFQADLFAFLMAHPYLCNPVLRGGTFEVRGISGEGESTPRVAITCDVAGTRKPQHMGSGGETWQGTNVPPAVQSDPSRAIVLKGRGAGKERIARPRTAKEAGEE